MVRGDIFPDIVTRHARALSIPLTSIYITESRLRPSQWKEESVTVIPKCRTPADIRQLRNISCTLLVSKVYESYVLQWALQQVTLKGNQYGGSKGCSTSHLLISTIWQNVLNDLEDCQAATILTAIDYAKAFNWMSFQECLRSLARHGASNQVIGLIEAFLTDRTMSVRVGSVWSRKRSVYGGVSQGSILGVLLFNITTDNLENEAEDNRGTDNKHWMSDIEAVDSRHAQSTPVQAERTEYNFDPGVTPLRRPISADGRFSSSSRPETYHGRLLGTWTGPYLGTLPSHLSLTQRPLLSGNLGTPRNTNTWMTG